MRLIVGLGNLGKLYERTRHNIGFDVIDEISGRFNIPLNQAKFKGVYGSGLVQGEKVILLKPLTYMNLSGESIRPLMDYYNISLEELLIIYDDLDLPTGKIRLREKGSAGGHNGIKSTIAHVGAQEFKRIRVGISRPQNGMAVADYVLGKFSSDEQPKMEAAAAKAAEACEMWLTEPFLKVMNTFNQQA